MSFTYTKPLRYFFISFSFSVTSGSGPSYFFFCLLFLAKTEPHTLFAGHSIRVGEREKKEKMEGGRVGEKKRQDARKVSTLSN